jgi:hypothetical protein
MSPLASFLGQKMKKIIIAITLIDIEEQKV